MKTRANHHNAKIESGILTLEAEVAKLLSMHRHRKTRSKATNGAVTAYVKKIVRIKRDCFALRAFMLAGRGNSAGGNILLILEPLNDCPKESLRRASSHFRISKREFEVVQLLINGCTNKEISKQMNIAECTVKDYLNNIMKKVHTSTRTGVVAKILTYSVIINGSLQSIAEQMPFY
jgi:DNA-binding NarL/FixJ family response regulator